MLCRPGLGNQRRARCPFSAHAQSQQQAARHKLSGRMRQPAQRGCDGVHQDADRQCAYPPVAVCEPAKCHPSKRGGDQRHRHHCAAHRSREMHLALDLSQHQRVEHHVHAVEHPSQRCRQQRTLLIVRRLGQPAVDAVQLNSAWYKVLRMRLCFPAVILRYGSGLICV
jgi:hypothetical protein